MSLNLFYPEKPRIGRCKCNRCKDGRFRVFFGRNWFGAPAWGLGPRKEKVTDAWRGEAHAIATRPICQPRNYRRSDRVAYWSYLRVALAAGVSPMSAEHWLLIAGEPSLPKYPRGRETDEERVPTPQEEQIREILADLAQATHGGFSVGELRRGGMVGGVRRQTSADGEGGHTVTWKTCKRCLELLPFFCFAKQLKGRRGSCRWCDNARRVEQRRNAAKA